MANSLRNPINSMCKVCIYDKTGGRGSWREQISQCTSLACPLWPVRTGPESGKYIRAITDPIIENDPKTAYRAMGEL